MSVEKEFETPTEDTILTVYFRRGNRMMSRKIEGKYTMEQFNKILVDARKKDGDDYVYFTTAYSGEQVMFNAREINYMTITYVSRLEGFKNLG